MIRSIAMAAATAACLVMGCSSTPPAESEPAKAAEHEPVKENEGGPYEVAKLKQRMDAGEKIFLLDVRRPEELTEHGAIEGHVNIPIDQLEDRLSEVPKDQPVVVYCMHGGRASRGADILAKHGYPAAQYGGITDWKDAGFAVVYPEGSSKKE